VLLDELVVAVVVRRPEQLAGDAALVDDLVIALGRVDLDFRRVEELAKVLRHHVIDGGLVGLERQAVGHGDVDRLARCRGVGGGLARDDDDEAVVLADDGARDLEELDRAAGGADGLGEGVEARVLGVERHREIRAVVGTAIHRRIATRVGTRAAFAAIVTPRAAGAALEIAARTPVAGKFAALGGTALVRGRGIAGARGGASRTLEAATVAAGFAAARAAVIAPRTIASFPPFRTVGRLLVLGPLGAEAEALQLGEVELVEIRRRIFLGSGIVHVVKSGLVTRVGWSAWWVGTVYGQPPSVYGPGGDASAFPEAKRVNRRGAQAAAGFDSGSGISGL